MHRIVSLPGSEPPENLSLVEQPSAPVLFLTSASTDITTLSSCLESINFVNLHGKFRALLLSTLTHPAQIDHYISTTGVQSKIIIIRILGGREHWSYGIERMLQWQKERKDRKLILISGTSDHEDELINLSNVEPSLNSHIKELLGQGGTDNLNQFLHIVEKLLRNEKIPFNNEEIRKLSDPYPWDWRDGQGAKVGLIYYMSLYKAGDIIVPKTINESLRKRHLVPRTYFVSSLSSKEIQDKIYNSFSKEKVEIVLTMTSFSSVKLENAHLGATLWKKLNVPVLQILNSTRSYQEWDKDSIGMDPIDLSIQIVLPELDGREITRPCAFKEISCLDRNLCTTVKTLRPNHKAIDWLVEHTLAWIKLRCLSNSNKRICIMLANYPIKDGRIANGVGLDTPESVVQILNWLKNSNYNLGEEFIPSNSSELMNIIHNTRTNSPESSHKRPLTYISLEKYATWWKTLADEVKKPILDRWGIPEESVELEKNGFPIHGIKFGNIVILIQPARGYDPTSFEDIHSPDLPPPHRYLAQYYWVRNVFEANAITHLGKHGTAEWLPGKGVGLSINCNPSLVLGHIPNIYPFIVNDPGEGSQAKRRGHAIIIDHLTPPLGRAELYGDLLLIEQLLDEYYTAIQLNSDRSKVISERVQHLIKKTEIDEIIDNKSKSKFSSEESLFDKIDSYLCELKEAQIRKGLHIFGSKPSGEKLLELMGSVCKSPSINRGGITQIIASELGLDLDPWIEDEEEPLTTNDQLKLSNHINRIITKNGHVIEWLDQVASNILDHYFNNKKSVESCKMNDLVCDLIKKEGVRNLLRELSYVWLFLQQSPNNEKDSFLRALSGQYIEAGPSGAPTRGREDVLPTGRNFYSVDLRGLPTEAAWDLGRRSANQILELHLMEKGEHLKHLALSVWGTSTMRNGGEDIAQLLALMGVTPIWDGASRRVIDIEVIPLSIIQRPRVDVTLRISGLFRDAFPNLIEIVYKAYQQVAILDETPELNPYASLVVDNKIPKRIFGSSPGSYGAGLQELIDSGLWESKNELAQAYMSWSKWTYNGSLDINEDLESLKSALKNVEVVLHNQDNREHDILDSDDYYQFHGGLSLAVEQLSKQKPTILIADHSRRERPRVKKLKHEIDKVIRSRVLNPLWIQAVKEHLYKGGFEMSATLDYIFGYDATTNMVSNWCYKEIYKNWLLDESTINFLKEYNPWSMRDIAERLLEASNRGLWNNADEKDLKHLREITNDADEIIENLS